jgi:hypothetical protein
MPSDSVKTSLIGSSTYLNEVYEKMNIANIKKIVTTQVLSQIS